MKINPYPYPFIVIEGIDGCGKTTLIEKLQKRDKNSIFTKEPTDGEIGQTIRKILQNNGCNYAKQKLAPRDLQRLYIKDRLEHRQAEAVFLKKFPVFSDRDFFSTMTYGMAEGLEPWWIFERHEELLGEYFFIPDLMLILDLSAEEAMKRSEKSGKKADYFEEKLAFREKIREAYLKFPNIIRKLYPYIPINIRIIDASCSPDEALESALIYIKDVFEKKK